MVVLATPIVDWTAMWKICLVTLAAGAGVVVLFGFMLLGLKFAQGPATQTVGAGGTNTPGADGAQTAAADHTPSAGARLGGFTLSLVCGLLCVGVVAVGVYAMTKKPSSKPATKAKSALVIPAGPGVKLTASSR